MNALQRYALAVGRVLVAVIFLANGFGIIPQAQPARELADAGAPAALVPLLMVVARTIEIGGGFGLMLGIYPRIAAIALIAFLVPASFAAHGFWQAVGTSTYIPQLLNFLKNVATIGGLLFVAATSDQPTLVPRPPVQAPHQ